MARLAALLAPEDDQRDTASVQGDEWWLELGPVDLDAEIVTLQRDDELVAAIAPRDDGRLRVAVFRPLDASSATSLINLSRPRRRGRQGATCATTTGSTRRTPPASMGQVYSAEAGDSYLSYWQYGLGILHDRTASPVVPSRSARSPRADPPRSPPSSASTTNHTDPIRSDVQSRILARLSARRVSADPRDNPQRMHNDWPLNLVTRRRTTAAPAPSSVFATRSIPHYPPADRPADAAVYVRHQSTGGLHCEVIAFFSPVPRCTEFDATPCNAPPADGLERLAGDSIGT